MSSLKKVIALMGVFLPLLAAAQSPPESQPTAPPAAEPTPPPPTAAPPAPAPPKPPLFQLYGTLNVNLQSSEASKATNRAQDVSNRIAISVDSTNVGVRGTAQVAYGLGVTYQCETSANIDGINVLGICNRNSRLGLSSPYGTLFYGNWDTPFKAAWYGTKADDPFGNTDVFDAANLMASPGFNTRSTAGNSAAGAIVSGFDLREQNSVAYWSPKYMGLSAKLQWGVNEFASTSTSAVRKGDLTPMLWGAALNFDPGPFSVLAAFERHDDFFGLDAMNPTATAHTFGATAANTNADNSVDQAWRVGAGYELGHPFGTTNVSFVYEQLYFQQKNAPTGSVKDFNRSAYQVALKHRMGNHELRLRYNNADHGDCKLVGGGPCSTTGYGAQNYTVGYAYYLAKSTQAYLFWTKIDNDRNAQYTFAVGGAAAVVGSGTQPVNIAQGGTPKGADPWALGLGMRYAF